MFSPCRCPPPGVSQPARPLGWCHIPPRWVGQSGHPAPPPPPPRICTSQAAMNHVMLRWQIQVVWSFSPRGIYHSYSPPQGPEVAFQSSSSIQRGQSSSHRECCHQGPGWGRRRRCHRHWRGWGQSPWRGWWGQSGWRSLSTATGCNCYPCRPVTPHPACHQGSCQERDPFYGCILWQRFLRILRNLTRPKIHRLFMKIKCTDWWLVLSYYFI